MQNTFLLRNRCLPLCVCVSVLLMFTHAPVQGQWFMESQNAPDLKICFQPDLEFYPALVDSRGKRFVPVQPGLTGGANTVSFESVDYPGYYMRHLYSALYMEPLSNPRNPDIFANDATFIAHINLFVQGYYAFEAENYRGHYIRHTGGSGLSINNAVGDESFGGDVSFRFTQKKIMLQPRTQEGCDLTHCKVARGPDSKAYIQNGGSPLNMVSPGLNGRHSSVSFQVSDSPDYYLRDYGGLAYMDPTNTTRNPYSFTQDATFNLRLNKFSLGYYSIESSKSNGYFLRAVDNLLLVSDEDGSPNYADQASFSVVVGPIYLESQNNIDKKIAIDTDGQAVISTDGARWNLMFPSLTGAPGTASLESFERPGFYLRHYEYLMDLEDAGNPRNPGMFNEDASFIVRRDIWFNDYIVLESSNYRNYSVRHDESRLQISLNEYESEGFRGDASFIMRDAPLDVDDGVVDDSGANVGAIVGGIIGLLLLVALIVAAVMAERKYHWTQTVTQTVSGKIQQFKAKPGSGADGGIANPSYPEAGFDEPDAGGAESAASQGAAATNTEGDVFTEEGSETRSDNAVRRLGRRLSDSVSKLKRTSSSSSKGEERRIEMPSDFDLNMRDFQPGFSQERPQQPKGSFDNPMFGLKRLSASTPEEDPGFPSSLENSQNLPPSAFKRNDSLLEGSPTLSVAPDFEQAMSFFDEQIDAGDKTSQTQASEDVYATVDPNRKKKISAAGISPISEDDIWEK